MSLVNQMLKDLEQRRAPEEGREQVVLGDLCYAGQAEAPKQGVGWRRLLAGALLLVGVVAGAGFAGYQLAADARQSSLADRPAPPLSTGGAPTLPAAASAGVSTRPASDQPNAASPLAENAPAPVPSAVVAAPSDPVAPLRPNPEAGIRPPAGHLAGKPAAAPLVDKGEAVTAPQSVERAAVQEAAVRDTAVKDAVVKELAAKELSAKAIGAKKVAVEDARVGVGNRETAAADNPTGEAVQPQQVQQGIPQKKPQKIHKQQRVPSAQARAQVALDEGLAHLRAGRPQPAQEKLQEALRLDPNQIKAREALALLLARGGATNQAIGVLREGLRLQPGSQTFSLQLARLLQVTGDLRGAIAVLEAQPPMMAAAPDYFAMLGALYQQAGDAEKALPLYRGLVDLRPEQGVWWMGLGIALEGTGKPLQARQAYRNARRSGSLSPALVHFVGERLSVLGG